MKRLSVRYAIIRFRPHIETEEFANVGIVLVAPEINYFDFRIETRRVGRYTGFFEELDLQFVRIILSRAKNELTRIRDLTGFDRNGQIRLDLDARERADYLFASLVKDREGVIVYSEVRYALHADPRSLLDDLFRHYVAREFADQEYREITMAKALKKSLRAAGLSEMFERKKYSDEIYSVNIPFVSKNKFINDLAIKPLFLGHENPGRIIDHANKWIYAVGRLRDQLPQRITFAVEGPREEGASARAFREATLMLGEAGIRVVRSETEALQVASSVLQ